MADVSGNTMRAALVGIDFNAGDFKASLEELALLARSAGAEPISTITAKRNSPDPAYFVGSGKADEIAQAVLADKVEIVIFNHALSPAQQRNLERRLGVRVVDRTSLILDIFAQRAQSHEGKLQVELAQLQHLATRLIRGWTHLERQKGGIGLRGPGETQLETDRRLVGQRMRVLTKRLAKIKQQRETGRARRAEIPVPSVTLVGYTNAGKSTLFRALTGSDAYVANQLFATLDPTVRRISLPGGTPVVIADTVGFIRELPHELVAAFQSTLTEAREATLLLHVVDACDPRREQHIAQVNAVLEEIGAEEIPHILVYNKVDRLDTMPCIDRDAQGRVAAVWISAERRRGLDLLANAIAERLALVARRARVRMPLSAGALRSSLYKSGAVNGERVIDASEIELDVELPDAELTRLARAPGVQIS
jgi:GTPase